MPTYNSSEIRNLAIIGHNGAGKTILSEAILASAKVIDRQGTIEAGNTVSDYHSDEHSRQISLSASPLHIEWLKNKLNFIDTPGYSDFVGEVIASLSVVDAALVVINAFQGLEVGTEQYWGYTEECGMPKLIVVTALDKEHTKFDEIIANARERLSKRVFALQLPINAGPGFNQIADVIRKKVLTYKDDGSGDYSETEPSGELKEQLEKLHQELIELVAESDDALLEKFFEQGGLTEEEMQGGLRMALVSGNLVPVFCAAAIQNTGVTRLLDFIAKYAPSPLDRPVVVGRTVGSNSQEVEIKLADKEPVLRVFKTLSEAHIGELSFFRVYAGSIQAGIDLYNATTSSSERMNQIFTVNGKNRENLSEMCAGDIGASVKLKSTHTGDTLCGGKREVLLPPIKFPPSNVRAAIKAKSKNDEEKVGIGLSTLREEDPTFRSGFDDEIRQTIISGQGEIHLQVALDKLKKRYNIEVELLQPRIPYRETIKAKADAKYRHKKQTGGAGQFAEVWMRIEPKARGEGVEFSQSLVGQNVDRVFVPSVEKGVLSSCEEGVLAGYRVVDVKADFYDGKMHPVDSKDIAFQIAGKGAFKECFLAAKPCLLEPIHSISVRVPEEFMGDVMGDISSRRGKILGMDSDGRFQVVKALVPEANLYNYSSTLRSITGGRGLHTRQFDHYEEMPRDQEQKVIEASKREREEA